MKSDSIFEDRQIFTHKCVSPLTYSREHIRATSPDDSNLDRNQNRVGDTPLIMCLPHASLYIFTNLEFNTLQQGLTEPYKRPPYKPGKEKYKISMKYWTDGKVQATYTSCSSNITCCRRGIIRNGIAELRHEMEKGEKCFCRGLSF